MEIQVFGPGCAACKQTEELVRTVAAKADFTVNIRKVTDIKEMMQAGVLSTPAVAIAGVLKCSGRIPSLEEIAEWIQEAAAAS